MGATGGAHVPSSPNFHLRHPSPIELPHDRSHRGERILPVPLIDSQRPPSLHRPVVRTPQLEADQADRDPVACLEISTHSRPTHPECSRSPQCTARREYPRGRCPHAPGARARPQVAGARAAYPRPPTPTCRHLGPFGMGTYARMDPTHGVETCPRRGQMPRHWLDAFPIRGETPHRCGEMGLRPGPVNPMKTGRLRSWAGASGHAVSVVGGPGGTSGARLSIPPAGRARHGTGSSAGAGCSPRPRAVPCRSSNRRNAQPPGSPRAMSAGARRVAVRLCRSSTW